MKSRQHGWLLVIVLLSGALLILAACTTAPTPTPSPTDTPPPTITPVPTDTLLPTATPTPLLTATATPLPLAAWTAEGDALLRQSDFAGAEAAYRRAIAADPAYAPAQIGLADALSWQATRRSDALAQAKKATELAPTSAAAYAILARVHLAMSSATEALTAAQRAVELDAQSALAQALLARARLADRRYDEARQAAEQAIKLDERFAEGYCVLSSYYRQTADFARSCAAIAQAISLEPSFAPWYDAAGNAWRQAGDYEKAAALYGEALELAPDDLFTLLDLAYLHMVQRAYGDAETRIQQAIQLAPDLADPYIAYGHLYVKKDKPDEALAQFRKALEKEPRYPGALDALGYGYLTQGECDLAARAYQDLLAAHPRLAAGPAGLGDSKLCADDLSKALEYYRKALELEPYHSFAKRGMGLAYSQQGRAEDAALALVETLRLTGSDSDGAIHQSLAEVLLDQGRADLAKDELRIALRLDPDSAEAHLELAALALDEDDGATAQWHAEKALALEPESRLAQSMLGAALVLQGEPKQGAALLEGVTKANPENAGVHYFLGLAYRDLGRYSEAKKELQTYLALNTEASNASMVEGLVKALEQGYILPEAPTLAALDEQLTTYLEREATATIKAGEDGVRTLVISFSSDPEATGQDVGYEVGVAAGIGMAIGARIDPPITGGLRVEITENDHALMEATMSYEDMKKGIAGLLSAQQVGSRICFKRLVEREAATVEEVKSRLIETRELTATADVPYHILETSALRERLASSLDQQAQGEMRTSATLLDLMDLIEPEVDLAKLLTDLQAEQVGGFYDIEGKAFYLLDRAELTAADEMIMAHEYTHALQDQRFNLKTLNDDSLDADQRLAFRAFIEGDATLSMVLYAEEHVPLYDLLESLTQVGGVKSDVLDASPAFIREMQLFPYRDGLQFTITLYQTGQWEAVNKAYANPPRSTEQILHPERYRQGDAPAVISLPDLATTLGSGWAQVKSDVLGELGLRLTLAEYIGPTAAALAAEGWSGDRYALLRQGAAGPHLLVMQTHWDSPQDANQFWSLYQDYMTHRPAYTEEVQTLIGTPDAHWWKSQEGWVFLAQQQRHVTVIISPDKDAIQKVAAVIAKQG